MELIKRYIYAVTQKLPVRQRADIEKELQSLIEDMLEERAQGGEVTNKEVEKVLLELGNPSELAAKYKGSKRYLISPEIFELYYSVLKIVMISTVIGLSVVFAIESVMNPFGMVQYFTNYLVSLITIGAQVFAWVTISFLIVEFAGVKIAQISKKKGKEWLPSDLPPIPNRKTQIKPIEPIVSIIFTVFFMVLFTVSIHLIGVPVFNGDSPPLVIPFFDLEVYRGYLPIIWILFALYILRECLKLLTREWTIKLVLYHLFINIITFVFALIMFNDSTIWNPKFIDDLVQSGLLSANSEAFQSVSSFWNTATQGFIYLVGAVLIIDSIIVLFKAFRIRVNA